MKKLLSKKEVAEMLGVSVQTVMRYKAAGKLPFVQLSPRTIKFKPEAVEYFVSEKQTEPFDIKMFKPTSVKPKVSKSVHEREKAELAKKLGF